MNSMINILYTPLDCPPQPEVDLNEFWNWIDIYWQGAAKKREHLKKIGKVGEDKVPNFPWKLTAVYKSKDGWSGEFDKKFPEISKYFVEAFGLELSDIETILLLPVKEDHEGLGFWHQDHDEYGLRMYLDFNDPGGRLMIKKTKLPYDNQPPISPRYYEKGQVRDIHDFLEDEIIDCKIIDPKQCYFLNNVRAAHATWTSKLGVSRIPVVIYHNNTKEVLDKIEKLVLQSVEKYKDYVLRWD